jgi:DNA-binding transcriptional LysR family regulator
LAALESALSTRLFARGPDGLSLTASGQDILPHAEAVLTHAEAIERCVEGGDGRIAGTVRLTIPEAIESYMIERLAGLRERHPELVVELVSDNRALDLRRGEADIAMRFRATTDPALVVRKLGPTGWSLYASPSYVARKGALACEQDLSGHDVLNFDASLSGLPVTAWMAEHSKGANVVLRGNSLGAVQRAAAFGFGIAPLPCFLADTDPLLVRLTPRVIAEREGTLAVHPDLVRLGRVRATMDFLVEVFEREAEAWAGVPKSAAVHVAPSTDAEEKPKRRKGRA